MMEEIVLSGDLGGTNLRLAAVDRSGTVLHRAEAHTPRHSNPEKIVEITAELADECRNAAGIVPESLVFAVPGPIDAETGRLFNVPNLPELRGSNLRSMLAEKLGIEVQLENDATAAAVGEYWRGASQGYGSSLCLTLGTGVGGGVIINGEPLRGPDGTAGEIGHVCVEPLGHPCGCGSNGCLEQYASATAIVRMARELLSEYPDAALHKAGDFDAEKVYQLGSEGDPLCIEAFRRVGMYLGIALAGLINVLNPEAVVIAGGAASGWDLFIETLRAEIRKRAFREPAERARIVRASLGNDAGIIGAAYLAFARKDAAAGP